MQNNRIFLYHNLSSKNSAILESPQCEDKSLKRSGSKLFNDEDSAVINFETEEHPALPALNKDTLTSLVQDK
jgi:hypothetical protein